MKILWRKFGFTTNSSGSYEWLPGQATTSTSSISSTGSISSTSLSSTSRSVAYSTSSTTSLPTTTPASGASLAGRVDLLIFLAAVLTGIVSVILLIKDIVKSNRNKMHVNNQKGKK